MELPWPFCLFILRTWLHRQEFGGFLSEKLRAETLQMLSGSSVASELGRPDLSTEMSVT